MLISWDFPTLEFIKNGLKKRKFPVSAICVGEKCLVDVTAHKTTGQLSTQIITC